MEMITVAISVVVLIAVTVCVRFFLAAKVAREVAQLENIVINDVILPARERLTGHNRFLIGEEILREQFPTYSDEAVKEVWKRLRDSKFVEIDPFDNAWCVR